MTRYAAGMQRMLGRRGGVVVALVLLLALLVPATALAVPTPGRGFYGDVLVDGLQAPRGARISITVNGSSEQAWLPSAAVDAEGRYGWTPVFKVPGDDPQTPAKEGAARGDEIKFFVSGKPALLRDVKTGQVSDSHIFESGGIVNLDLEVEGPLEVNMYFPIMMKTY